MVKIDDIMVTEDLLEAIGIIVTIRKSFIEMMKTSHDFVFS